MSDTTNTQRTQPGPAEEADGAGLTEQATDPDLTATATPDGELDEAGEDEQVEGGLVDRALEEPTD
ncbi:MAG TPA: hypothetical protein VNR37_07790 [Microbacteriaceae bacterium]|nr:hypothetical protein [Microbacteriaceae bacterium]